MFKPNEKELLNWSQTDTVFYVPVYQFTIRIVLGVLTALYFFFLPIADLALDRNQIGLAILCYFIFHVLWWRHFRKKGVQRAGIRLANWVDLLAAGLAIAIDPYPLPPTAILILIAILGNGIQHGLDNFVHVARNGILIGIVAVILHFYLLSAMPPYSFYFFIGLLFSCMLYAYALVRRIEGLKNRAEALAQTDELTGLMNRRAFMKTARYLLSLYDRTHLSLVFIFADLDGFKSINDTMGHDTGDLVLSQFAEMIKMNFRRTDITARYGGDEFVFILTDSDVEDARKVMHRLEDQLVEWADRHKVRVGISWGMKAVTKENVDVDDILRDADEALYIEKDKKKGRYRR